MGILKQTLRSGAIAACGLLLVSQSARSARLVSARVTGIEGTVEQRTAARPVWHASTVQAELLPGEAIRTSRYSRAELSMADGGVTRLAPTTTLRIGTTSDPGRLKLLLGKLYMKFARPHAALKIETPSMTAAIVGTEFLASVSEEDVSHVTVFEGKVEVTGVQGDKVEVNPGEWVEVEPNKPVGRPTAFGMVQLRRTDPLLRTIGEGLGTMSENDVWR